MFYFIDLLLDCLDLLCLCIDHFRVWDFLQWAPSLSQSFLFEWSLQAQVVAYPEQ